MKISIKTQTARSTQWHEGLNCVNLFLQDKVGDKPFAVGLQVTEWGEKTPIEPCVIITIGHREHRFTVTSLIESFKEAEGEPVKHHTREEILAAMKHCIKKPEVKSDAK